MDGKKYCYKHVNDRWKLVALSKKRKGLILLGPTPAKKGKYDEAIKVNSIMFKNNVLFIKQFKSFERYINLSFSTTDTRQQVIVEINVGGRILKRDHFTINGVVTKRYDAEKTSSMVTVLVSFHGKTFESYYKWDGKQYNVVGGRYGEVLHRLNKIGFTTWKGVESYDPDYEFKAISSTNLTITEEALITNI
jgi:hypothetical protein